MFFIRFYYSLLHCTKQKHNCVWPRFSLTRLHLFYMSFCNCISAVLGNRPGMLCTENQFWLLHNAGVGTSGSHISDCPQICSYSFTCCTKAWNVEEMFSILWSWVSNTWSSVNVCRHKRTTYLSIWLILSGDTWLGAWDKLIWLKWGILCHGRRKQ